MSIAVSLFDNVSEVSRAQAWNAKLLIVVTEFGSMREVNPLYSPISEVPAQPSNALLPITVTVSGSVREMSPEQPRKRPYRISVMVFGSVTEVSSIQR